MTTNGMAVRPAKRQVVLGNGTTYVYGTPKQTHPVQTARSVLVLRSPHASTTIWPGQYLNWMPSVMTPRISNMP